MGSTRRKGMLNVLIAAVLWGLSVARSTSWSKAVCRHSSRAMIRLLFAGLILVTFSFMHGDKIFSILKTAVP